MKKIELKTLKLLNFKGVRSLDIEFGQSNTKIYGQNGTGKTTIFDAFTWLMYGKDSLGRAQFEIKTLDEEGQALKKLDHDVAGLLTVDGREVYLRRCCVEKWVKKRGETEPQFIGNEVKRYYNDVPVSQKEWQQKINNICDENIFQLISNPEYFASLKPDAQRKFLYKMSGDVSDVDVVGGDKALQPLLGLFSEKPKEELKREIASKMNKVKKEMAEMPARICERKRDIVPHLPAPDLEERSKAEQRQIALRKQMADVTEAYNDASRERVKLLNHIGGLEIKYQERINALRAGYAAELHRRMKERGDREWKMNNLESQMKDCLLNANSLRIRIKQHEEKLNDLRAKWRSIKGSKLVYDDSEFVCPTCGRALELNDVLDKRRDIEARFNLKKAADLEENSMEGKSVKESSMRLNKELQDLDVKMQRIQVDIKDLKKGDAVMGKLAEPDIQSIIDADRELSLIRKEIEHAQAEANTNFTPPNNDVLENEINECQKFIDSCRAQEEAIKRNDLVKKRIIELEQQTRCLAQQLADYEHTQDLILAFEKRKVSLIESRINALFRIVRFRMFEQQINGGEIETCEITVNGVPYSDLNHSMKINAGIDVINAMIRHFGVATPLFIDNAESINALEPVATQTIELIVSTDEELKIERV